MQTSTGIIIHADPQTVFRLGTAVEHWPQILPHYRWVHVVEDHGDHRIVEMAAWRDIIPVRWWAEQRCDPEQPLITFHHVGGVTKGMDVQWTFTPMRDSVLVEIHHQLALGWPIIGGVAADRIIGPLFIDNIAGKTLKTIKRLAEQHDLKKDARA